MGYEENFELLSGLQVNFQKYSIIGIGIAKNRLEGMAGYLGCSVGSIPFLFLGIKVGLIRNSNAEWSE